MSRKVWLSRHQLRLRCHSIRKAWQCRIVPVTSILKACQTRDRLTLRSEVISAAPIRRKTRQQNWRSPIRAPKPRRRSSDGSDRNRTGHRDTAMTTQLNPGCVSSPSEARRDGQASGNGKRKFGLRLVAATGRVSRGCTTTRPYRAAAGHPGPGPNPNMDLLLSATATAGLVIIMSGVAWPRLGLPGSVFERRSWMFPLSSRPVRPSNCAP